MTQPISRWYRDARTNDEAGPPPEGTRINHLLDQRTWWLQQDLERGPTPRSDGPLPFDQPEKPRLIPIRVCDLSHDHRMSVLGFLRRRAHRLKFQEEMALAFSMSGPFGPSGDMAVDACDQEMDELMNESDAEWIERQPLIRELVRWTTPLVDDPRLPWRHPEWPTLAPMNTVVLVRVCDGDYSTELQAGLDRSGRNWVALPGCYDFNEPVHAYRDGCGRWFLANGVRMPRPPFEWTELLDTEPE